MRRSCGSVADGAALQVVGEGWGGDDGTQQDTGERPEATACCFAWWNGEEVQTDAGGMQSSLHRLFPARKKSNQRLKRCAWTRG